MAKLTILELIGSVRTCPIRVFHLDSLRIGISRCGFHVQYKPEFTGEYGVFEEIGGLARGVLGKLDVKIWDDRWREGEWDGYGCSIGAFLRDVFDLFDGSFDQA